MSEPMFDAVFKIAAKTYGSPTCQVVAEGPQDAADSPT